MLPGALFFKKIVICPMRIKLIGTNNLKNDEFRVMTERPCIRNNSKVLMDYVADSKFLFQSVLLFKDRICKTTQRNYLFPTL
jgi:hypothetical protein